MRRKLESTYSHLSKNTPFEFYQLTFSRVEAKEPTFMSTECISACVLDSSRLRDSILSLRTLFALARALF